MRDYLGSALFAARLAGEKDALDQLRRDHDLGPADGGKTPLEVIGALEEYAGRDVFPPHWLFHDDYSDYGDFIGEYFAGEGYGAEELDLPEGEEGGGGEGGGGEGGGGEGGGGGGAGGEGGGGGLGLLLVTILLSMHAALVRVASVCQL